MPALAKKVLIDNRGEIALRIFQTCQKLGIGAVVGYSSRDADSLAVRTAREAGKTDDRYSAVLLGGDTAATSYEDYEGVIASARAYGCDSVHPGYGFLSERADAADAVTKAGLTFIGPRPDVIRQVGNKSEARDLAQRCDVPRMPASPLIHRYAEAQEWAAKIDYPFVLKADSGGGGMNNLFVETEADFVATFENFSLRNPGGFYLEKKLDQARHIELQLAADTLGNVIVLGERDCTAQRKSQKVVEEAPVTVAPDTVLDAMRADAIKMAKTAGYTGVGTWEFLYDPAAHEYYFMEINPRIQVEHTVTECGYDGLDIVEWQLIIAAGERLPTLPPYRSGHTMQLRLYAEDPRNDFRQNPGVLSIVQFPETGPDLRIDRGYDEGDTVQPGFDATIAKLIVHGDTREQARSNALAALNATLISGVTTNRDFLRWLLVTPEFSRDTLWTTFIEPAWIAEQKQVYTDITRFVGSGTFAEQPKPATFDGTAYTQNLTYTRRGTQRDYASDLARLHTAHPDSCGFRFGMYTYSDGTRVALGYWDFSVMGGTLGSEEGAAVAALFKLAHEEKLNVVTITSSSGARQQEGAKALEMMDVMVAARWQYAPPLYMNVYSGLNFGGVTVSLAESADISLAVTGSKVGFAGPDLVSRMMGLKKGSELEVGAHSAEDAMANRSIDLIVENLAEARDRVHDFNCIATADSVLSTPHPYYQTIVPTTRYDRPATERFVTHIGALNEALLTSQAIEGLTSDTVSQKRLILADPSRPSAADLLNPALSLFDAVAPLANRQLKEASEEYPPIIGALGRIGAQPVMVLGQQIQRRRTNDGRIEKVYVAPRARDYAWALRKVMLANQLGLPIVLLCDTTGGDASLGEEAAGVSRVIADFLGVFYKPGAVTVPTISINIGENGSGGGLTFGRPLDASADVQNALTFVATPDAQIKILTDTWPQHAAESATIIDQLHDATADGRATLGLIDEVIPEPTGGFQADPQQTAEAVRRFIMAQIEVLCGLSADELITRRYERVAHAGQFGLTS